MAVGAMFFVNFLGVQKLQMREELTITGLVCFLQIHERQNSKKTKS